MNDVSKCINNGSIIITSESYINELIDICVCENKSTPIYMYNNIHGRFHYGLLYKLSDQEKQILFNSCDILSYDEYIIPFFDYRRINDLYKVTANGNIYSYNNFI